MDVRRRLPVWQALARLFGRRALTDEQYRDIAHTLEGSGYKYGELREIYEEEVAPVCYTNLFEITRTDVLDDPEWLRRAIVAHLRQREQVPRWWPFGQVSQRLGVKMTEQQWHQVMRFLHRLRRDPGEVAQTLADTEDVATLVRALEDLALIGPPGRRAAPALPAVLAHADFRVRAAAVRAAAQTLRVDALDTALAAIEDPSPTVREAALQALHNILDTVVHPLPQGADGSVAPTFADRVVAYVTEEALAEIRGYLSDHKASVRLHAARIIELLGPQARPAVAALFDRFDDRNEAVRLAVAEAVVAVEPRADQALVELRKRLFDHSARVRQTAARCLATFLAAGDERYREALEALRQALGDSSAAVRQGAAAALGWMGTQAADAVPLLAELVDAPEPATRAAALFALGRMEEAALSELPTMTAALRDDRPEVRRAALRAFRQFGPDAASLRGQFEMLLGDPDWLTQFEARRTLEIVCGA